MEDKERKELLKKIKIRQKEVQSSKEAATQYLIELGVMTRNGNYKKRFKALG